MQSVEQTVISNYTNNMEYLKKYHNEVFHKVDIFQSRIESGIIEEKYALDYIKNEYFDVQDLKSKNYLYSDNSLTISKQLTDQVNYKKPSFSFQGFSLLKGYENVELSDIAQSHQGIYPIMSFYLDKYPYETTMKKIEKFIFIGVGLGQHIQGINDKINAEHSIIIEDDLELFRLSLFVTPYYKIFKDKNVIFSIATNKDDFNRDFNSFLETSFYLNRLIKYSYFPAHSKEKIQLIKNALASQNFLTFGYNTGLKKLLKPLDFINNGYKVLNLSQKLQLSSIKDKPVLIIGAGPSLGDNIEWLKENQNDFIIFAVATSLKILYENDIKPDIVSHIDGFQAGFKNFESFDMKSFVKDSIAILGSFVENRVIDLFNKDLTFMVEEDTFYFDKFTSVAAPCIGSTSVANALFLGFKEIYLLGLDLALSDDGSTHSKGHESNNGKYNLDEEPKELSSLISLRGDLFEIAGNFKEKVKTTPLFYSSLNSINNSIRQLATQEEVIYNLSNGVYIKNSLPVLPTELKKLTEINKNKIRSDLYEELSSLSKIKLDKQDLSSMQKRLAYAKSTQNIIKKYEKHTVYDPVDNYLYNLYGLIMDLYPNSTRENRNITHIFDMFFQYTIPMIYDMANTKEKEDSISKDLKAVDKLLVKELKNISQTYIKRLELFLKERC
jgi:hypothetical protein